EGKLKVEEGDAASLHGAFAELVSSRPGVLGLFRRRKLAMRGAGRFVEARRAAADMRDGGAPGVRSGERSFLREPMLREPTVDAPSRSVFEARRTRVIVPRNAPCPCGSGRKFKNCCGRNER